MNMNFIAYVLFGQYNSISFGVRVPTILFKINEIHNIIKAKKSRRLDEELQQI